MNVSNLILNSFKPAAITVTAGIKFHTLIKYFVKYYVLLHMDFILDYNHIKVTQICKENKGAICLLSSYSSKQISL